ncbi:hypothetical protein [Pseudomonas sp. PD9R]|uniref:hypothetical protein n=1 Tax=Pseudomonas sp. PD9R TaxID=2853534 RepID=UPI001C4595C9|nr:hypothetical protein [Pseudomonas sp. PD9R]MBV6823856.1 hypothetical protein [Pseudomonas sp. PD9R]
MSFSATAQPPKGRGPSRSLTKAELKLAWDRIRSAAASGDLQASALLIALAEQRPLMTTATILAA